ncbi:MAG: F0F1 ATP synthase subunit alpha, partial [Oscillospiraceae bacterium]|nr:F0F1 ATP synthase subunit alpha [Oscillospiraceae bacterium]
DIAEFEKGLFDFVLNTRPEIVNTINDTKDLSDETKAAVIEAITDFKAKFVPSK